MGAETFHAIAGAKKLTIRLRIFLLLLGFAGLLGIVAPRASAQLLEPAAPAMSPNPLSDATINPGKMQIFHLEAQFEKDVVARGGAGFASWFAPDGVALGNGKPPLIGKVAIAKSATWSPKDYQLTWTTTGATMSASADMGYAWGHYDGHSKDANGNPVVTSGRFITVWAKQPDGTWKVALDAGANDAPAAGDCCKLPTVPQ